MLNYLINNNTTSLLFNCSLFLLFLKETKIAVIIFISYVIFHLIFTLKSAKIEQEKDSIINNYLNR